MDKDFNLMSISGKTKKILRGKVQLGILPWPWPSLSRVNSYEIKKDWIYLYEEVEPKQKEGTNE